MIFIFMGFVEFTCWYWSLVEKKIC